jgi:CheY-like chemotaxis protein
MTTQKVVKLTFADEGIEVITADDGDSALRLFTEHRPDVVLADVNIPGLNGYEVCETIRRTNDPQTTPVVLLVGSFEPFDAEAARRVGANDYLTKPFSSIRRLIATVLGLLEAKNPKPEAAESSNAVETNQTVEAQTPAMAISSSSTSTLDIDQLYNQSFAETVEMPHTVAEKAAFNDGSGDDELIETTFNAPEQQEPENDERFAATFEQASAITESESADSSFEATIPIETGSRFEYLSPIEQQPIPEPATEPLEKEQEFDYAQWGKPEIGAPNGDVVFDSFAQSESNVELDSSPVLQIPPPQLQTEITTEEFRYDQQNEETYFEPAAETPTEPVAHTEMTEPGIQTQDDPPRPSTPWDSVATPSEHSFKFDDSNLLELPTVPEGLGSDANGHSAPETGISAELVERIARSVASQISAQLVQEIVERIVPRVVEETMAKRTAEEADR